jgi:DNA-binding transcriptional ArsR family regulator
MLAIRLSPADLARVRIVAVPHPVGTAVLASQALREPAMAAAAPALAARFRRAAAGLGPLLHLLPARGILPDFLTPRDGLHSIEDGLATVRATSARRIRSEVGATCGNLRPTASRRRFATADPELLDALVASLRHFCHEVLAPDWPTLLRAHHREVAELGHRYALSGVDGVLAGLHPAVRWRSPVLEIDTLGRPASVRAGGHGVLLCPSPFAGPRPRVQIEPGRPALVVVQSAAPAWPDGDPLSNLMGRTRAAVLRATARPGRHTTSTLARDVDVSASSASEHLTALRTAGLVASARDGRAVVHRATALGLGMAPSGEPLDQRQRRIDVTEHERRDPEPLA